MRNLLDLYQLRERDLTASTNLDTPSPPSQSTTSDAVVAGNNSLRGRKGWGDRSVNHLLAAVDGARSLEAYR